MQTQHAKLRAKCDASLRCWALSVTALLLISALSVVLTGCGNTGSQNTLDEFMACFSPEDQAEASPSVRGPLAAVWLSSCRA